MQRHNQARRVTIEGERGGEVGGFADGDAEDARAEPSPAIAPAEGDGSARVTALSVPSRAEQAPLVEFLPPLERVEPDAKQRDKKGPVIDHPLTASGKKRDLRNRRGRKRPPYVSTGRPVGNPEFVPTDEQRMFVMVMIGMAVKQETIAQMIAGGISPITLVKHFSEEIKHGRSRFVANIKGHLARAAQNGSVRAQTYLIDRLGGPEFQRGGRDEGEPAIQINADARVTIFLPDNKRTDNS